MKKKIFFVILAILIFYSEPFASSDSVDMSLSANINTDNYGKHYCV